jgi:hypothetical protein
MCGQAESAVKCECFKVIYVLEGFVENRKNFSNIYCQICGKHRLSTQGLQFQQTWHKQQQHMLLPGVGTKTENT